MIKKILDYKLLIVLLYLAILTPSFFTDDNGLLLKSYNLKSINICQKVKTKHLLKKCIDSYLSYGKEHCGTFPEGEAKKSCFSSLQKEIAPITKIYEEKSHFRLILFFIFAILGIRFIYWFEEWRKPY